MLFNKKYKNGFKLHYFLFQSDTCTIFIPELKSYSNENYPYDPYVKNDLNSIILDDIFRFNDISVYNIKSQENLFDESKRPSGNFTTVEGIMQQALENVKTLKKQAEGMESLVLFVY